MDSSLADQFEATCRLVGSLENRKPAQRTGAGDGLSLRLLLGDIKTHLLEKINEDDLGKLFVKTGSGNGYVAKVPWIFISKEAGPVASKIGVAICFGRAGNGIVLGKMYPIGVSRGQEIRSTDKGSADFIDVDGDSINTRYNDRFVNPVQISVKSDQFKKLDELIVSKLKTL